MKKLFTLLLIVAAFSSTSKVQAAFGLFEYSTYYGDKDIVKVFPNPMISDATVRLSEDVDLENSKVTVLFYNMVGSEVFRITQVKTNDIHITKENFKNTGMYFYQLKVDEKIISTGRITVR